MHRYYCKVPGRHPYDPWHGRHISLRWGTAAYQHRPGCFKECSDPDPGRSDGYADPDNEVRIQEALAALAKDKTVILIAHRLSTVVGADRIFVLKDGKIAESGSLDDLQKQDGIFAEMMMDYASSIQWKVEKEAIK